MIKIGMMLGDRYEVVEKIGTGGMSDVYKAKDFKLNRNVAVKVLKQEFSENANFVSRFRVEAQAAAGLMHPNVVNVYDVGEEDDVNYIVMELVEGITLKKYIEKKARLSFKEAVSIAIQVSMGIEAAHNNGIIHRDIKPQNIIISRDGKVKVTDFGIAKAATSNTITSNVMGSVHYTSPEQARGGYSDEKSDIYSMGITLFEMLTGRVPFNGESTVAIAIKHIQEEIPHPRDFVTEIPASVDSIVIKCCQKSPDRRYANMSELLSDLKQALITPFEEVAVIGDGENKNGGNSFGDDGELEYLKNGSYDEEGHSSKLRLKKKDKDEEQGDDRFEKITLLVVIGAAVIILILIALFFIGIIKGFGKDGTVTSPITPSPTPGVIADSTPEPDIVKSVEIPNIIGLDLNTAINNLTRLGIDYDTEYTQSDTVEENQVMLVMDENRMVIKAGDKIRQDTKVILSVSAGAAMFEVPNVVNMEYSEAYNQIISAGFLTQKEEKNSDTVPEGYVIAQTPKGLSEAASSTIVKLTVSLGPKIVESVVPKFVGMSEEDATIMIYEKGMKVGNITRVFDADYPEGTVCYQSIKEGSSVVNGTSIDLRISLGVKKTLYKCNLSIVAPADNETRQYVPGMEVTLKLVADDGKVLLETVVKNFPQSVNYSGIESDAGTLTLSFEVGEEKEAEYQKDESGEYVLDENGNKIEISPATHKQTVTVSRRHNFVQE